MLTPRRPTQRQICQLSDRFVALVGAPKANNNPVLHIRRGAAQNLPIAIIIVGNSEDGQLLPEYLHR